MLPTTFVIKASSYENRLGGAKKTKIGWVGLSPCVVHRTSCYIIDVHGVAATGSNPRIASRRTLLTYCQRDFRRACRVAANVPT